MKQFSTYIAVGISFISVLVCAFVSKILIGDSAPFLVASLGAAAVLLYCSPESPMSRAWPVIGGHLLSSAVGVTCYLWIPDINFAAAGALSLSILFMHWARCLHPPGGAAALVAVIGGDAIHNLGYYYIVAPVGINVLILLFFHQISLRLNFQLRKKEHAPNQIS